MNQLTLKKYSPFSLPIIEFGYLIEVKITGHNPRPSVQNPGTHIRAQLTLQRSPNFNGLEAFRFRAPHLLSFTTSKEQSVYFLRRQDLFSSFRPAKP